MSTEVKKKKKKGSRDNNKLIVILAVALAVIVVGVSLLSVLLFTTGNYVAKLNGQKLYNYEYTYYLNQQISEMQNGVEVPEGADEETSRQAYVDFYTTQDENGQYALDRCKDQALEELRLFKTSYQLACKAGYELTDEQKDNSESYVDYMINYYYSMYSSYGSTTVSYDDVVRMVCGDMTVKQYKDYTIQVATIEKYKEAMKEEYDITEEELRAVYDENVDTYRKVTIQKFFLSTQSTAEDGTTVEMTEEEKAEVKAKAEDYLAKFQSGEYSFEEKITSDSEESGSADDKGVATVGGDSLTGVTVLDDWAKAQTAVSEDGVYELLEGDSGYYIVRCTDIEDFDNSEDSSEGANDSIKNTIKSKIATERADAQMKEEAQNASGYDLSDEKIKKINELFNENSYITSLIDSYGAKVSA